MRIIGDFYVEGISPGRSPYIAAGDLPDYEAAHWQRVYSEKYPGSTFAVKRHGMPHVIAADVEDQYEDAAQYAS